MAPRILANPTIMTMETIDTVCDQTQQEISFALDESRPIPHPALEHARACPQCAVFLSAWTSGLHQCLASPLPPAGIDLRESVLALPSRPSTPGTGRFSKVVSAVAVLLLLGIAGHLLIDIRPARTRTQAGMGLQDREIAALKSDFRRGLGALRAPSGAIRHVLAP